MKRLLVIVLGPILIIGLGSCGLFRANTFKYEAVASKIPKLEIEILMQDSTLNVRALEVDKAGTGIFATSKGDVGFIYESKGLNLDYNQEEELRCDIFYGLNFGKDSVANFRSVAKTKNTFFALTIGNPAIMFSAIDDEIRPFLYEEHHPNVFYDAMEFWNDEEGIAIGDSIDGCLSVIITRDGGNTWAKLTCDQLPKGIEGEGAFAASDTNIAIVGDHTWVATTAGRLYFSDDKGLTWSIYNTPIVKDKDTEGIYSIAFYDIKNGFAIGGDYTKPEENTANKMRTRDGGKTWQLVAQNESPGYRSCVQYVPESKAQKLVALGFKGIDYSDDAGDSWTHLSDESFYTIRFLNDSVAYAAGDKRIAKLTFRK
ncbi:WD40/YVTN/BNR-like repeat-containing protein [Psychroserpens damuponensis]|uniref:WD40/YVTN/BNR-like repeat-containing protein n=1 Tax=Psychroserpens damuponensis TaxID=943936 RepID=UPI00058E5593|nr:oxidoreductase [Psychroserpens damuponensis]